MNLGCVIVGIVLAALPDGSSTRKPKEALRAFNDLIGSWRCTGMPEGTREEKQRGFWTETLGWSWQFKGDDASLLVDFDKGKHFTKGVLRYLPDKDLFQLTVTTPAKENLVFAGPLKKRVLTLERNDNQKKETQRLVFTLLHANRFLYAYEVKPSSRTRFTRIYQVGATKEGVAFAGPADATPECVVTGGRGTLAVTHNGKTYHVCCSGCKEAFKEDPEKYIKEAAERNAKE